jgi:hypothetical protein
MCQLHLGSRRTLSAALKLSTEKLEFLTKLVGTKPRAAVETVLQSERGCGPEYSE